jgi:hypothetical protein
MRFARVVLATLLLASVVESVAPVETFATGSTCTLACCAGRAPHAAGSCMDGSCHAAIKRHAHQTHRSELQIPERLCSLTPRAMRRNLSLAQTTSRKSIDAGPQPAQLSNGTFTKPCLADCGTASGSVAQDYRNHALVTRRYQARPGLMNERAGDEFSCLMDRVALLGQHPPRAPPIPFV